MSEPRIPQLSEIKAAVCAHFGVQLFEMSSHRRGRAVARPRQVAMYLACEMTPLSLPAIGRHFGGRDHTTVMHARRMVPEFTARDKTLSAAVDDIRARLLADPNQFLLPLVAAVPEEQHLSVGAENYECGVLLDAPRLDGQPGTGPERAVR